MKIPRARSVRFAPFLDDVRDYSFSFFRSDILAAIAVALMTIPQSIAYALLAGLPPTSGLFAAIFGMIFTAGFGSSRYLVSGPSTGTAILLQTSVAEVLYGGSDGMMGAVSEKEVLYILAQIVLLVGGIQIFASFFNVSKLLQFVSRPVILGYFAGITVAVAATQVFALSGMAPPTGDDSILLKATFFFQHMMSIQWLPLILGMSALFFLLFMRRRFPSWPNALTLLALASLAAFFLNRSFGEGAIPLLASYDLPKRPIPEFMFPLFDLKTLSKIFPAAVAIAFLAILEIFSLSRNFAAKSGEEVEINQDVFGLGLANLSLSFLSQAMPASGSATRTSLNYRLGAKTRFASVFSGCITGAIILFCWPLVQMIPLAALAALLIATVHTLMDWKEIRLSFRATQEDGWTFLLTFFACLIFTLDIAFFVGILISISTYLKKTATPQLVEYAFNAKGRLMGVSPKDEVHRQVRIIGIGGDLYFATADVFQMALQSIAKDRNVRAIVLRLNNVHHMDASMCVAILHLFETLKVRKAHLVISGITEEVWQVFHRSGIVKEIGLNNFYFTDETNPQFSTWKAAMRAQELIHSS